MKPEKKIVTQIEPSPNGIYAFALAALLLVISFGCKPDQNEQGLAEAVVAATAAASTQKSPRTGYNWNLPTGWPTPVVPADNPMSEAKVELGRHLFYDKRLSLNQTMACASCHIQSLAFSDGRPTGLGSTGEFHPRSPQHLVNTAYNTRQTWSNNQLATLEEQALAPLYGTAPIEMGLTHPDSGTPEAIARLQSALDVDYPALFAAAFGGDGNAEITDLNIRRALASFQRTFISGNSYFEEYQRGGDVTVLTNAGLNSAYVIAGASLFNNEVGDCFHCHGGFNFTDTTLHSGSPGQEFFFHSNGIYSDTDYGAMNDAQKGLFSVTGLSGDVGRFRAPSLRNIAVTYPYMHDGSIGCAGYTVPLAANDASYTTPVYDEACAREALATVIAHYNSGGQSHQAKDSSLIRPLGLTAIEQLQLVEFMLALTDSEFLTRASLSNPQSGNTNFVEP